MQHATRGVAATDREVVISNEERFAMSDKLV